MTHELMVASLALPVKALVNGPPGGGSSGSDGEVLLSADVARLSRYNDEVAT